MCGISGFINKTKVDLHNYYNAHLTMSHRGPDDEGYLFFLNNRFIKGYGENTTSSNRKEMHIGEIRHSNICLGHHRLSIIDLSENAHQPFLSEDDRYAIVYNGEIYNYLELREKLESYGYEFRTKSDTEVLLCAFQHWGVECFNRFNGMWALAILDTIRKRLYLCRDRFGIKPLYTCNCKEGFFFGSEIKFFKALKLELSLNCNAAAKYIDTCLVDNNTDTFYNEIRSFPQANYAEYSIDGELLNEQRYWNIDSQEDKSHTLPNAINKLRELFFSSLELRMRSDVPVGTLLSGGIDSTSIISLLCKYFELPQNQIHSFSAVFLDERYSEYSYIKQTIDKYKQINPQFIYPSEKEIAGDLTQLFETVEVPFRSFAVYSQFCLYRFIKANSNVKVLLNGQGGDELFAGYTEHYSYYFLELIKKLRLIKMISEICYLKQYRKGIAFQSIHQTLYSLSKQFRNILISEDKENNKRNNRFSFLNYEYKKDYLILKNLKDKLIHDLTISALPEYLRYEDRNSMAFSLESRLPFLDYRFVEFAFSLASSYKIDKGINKKIVRTAFYNEIHDSILNRKDKMGFVSPQTKWQRKTLKKLMDDVILSKDKSGLINQKILSKMYINSKDSKSDIDSFLWWRLFCFKYWYNLNF